MAIVVKITAFLIGAPCIVYPWFLSVGYLAELYGNIVGFIGGFFLAPITIVVVPILMGMEYGAWFPLIMLWVGGFVAAQLNEIGNYLDNIKRKEINMKQKLNEGTIIGIGGLVWLILKIVNDLNDYDTIMLEWNDYLFIFMFLFAFYYGLFIKKNPEKEVVQSSTDEEE